MGDYQFYQLTDEGKPAPEAQAPRPYRSPVLPWVFLAVLVALLIAGLVFAINVIRSSTTAGETRSLVESRYEEALSSCLEGGDGSGECEASVRKDLATEFEDAKLCRDLVGEAKVNCVTVTATVALDPSACATLSGAQTEACEDLVYAIKARAEGDANICEKISNEERKGICLGDFGVMTEALTRAIEANDPNVCTTLEGEDERLACIDEYQSIDSDGDGYSDYEEVQNGFNPQE